MQGSHGGGAWDTSGFRMPGTGTRLFVAAVLLVLVLGLILFVPQVTERASASNHEIDVATVQELIDELDAASQPGAQPVTLNLTSPEYVLEDSHGELVVTGEADVTIKGNGATIRRDDDAQIGFRIFRVDEDATLHLIDVTVSDGVLIFQAFFGAGIQNDGILILTNSIVENNSSSSLAGGIYNNGELTMVDSQVRGNVSSWGSGGILNEGEVIHPDGSRTYEAVVALDNSQVSGNVTLGHGGGIENWGVVTAIDSYIDQNTGDSGGGILNDGSLILTNTVVTENVSATWAGGILNNGDLTLNNSVVSDNEAEHGGGGITNFGGFDWLGVITITDSTINGNEAGSGGGGIENYATLTIIESTLSENEAGSGGGGIENFGPLTLTDSHVSLNESSSGGGGILNWSGDVVLTDSFVTNNISGAGGGGINNQWMMTLINTVVSGNHAGGSGGITNVGGELTLIDSEVSGNSASGNVGGLSNTGDLMTLINTQVIDNSADGFAGGINSQSPTIIVNSTISGNSSAERGGGIVNGWFLTVVNSTISGNSAGTHGGGIAIDSSEVTLINSTISGNAANSEGGGIYNDRDMTLSNSIVWGNDAPIDPEIRSGTGDRTASYSLFPGGCPALGANADCDENSVIDDDPLFVDWIDPSQSGWEATTDGDYQLQSASPAIDTGSNDAYHDAIDALPQEVQDLFDRDLDKLGNPRFVDQEGQEPPRIDMGAYEANGLPPSEPEPDPGTPETIELSVMPSQQTVGDSVLLTANVNDDSSNPVPDGTVVTFEISGNNVEEPTRTDGGAGLTATTMNGVATLGYKKLFPGVDSVTALAGDDPEIISDPELVTWVLPDSTIGISVNASGGWGAGFDASAAVGRRGGPAGAVSYNRDGHRFSTRSVDALVVDGNHAVIYTRVYLDGQTQWVRVDVHGGGSNTAQVRWPGYDSGTFGIRSVRIR